MIYQDYQNHLKVSEYLGKEPTGVYGDIYHKFNGLWDGISFMVSNYDIYAHNGENTLFRIDLEDFRFQYMIEHMDLRDYLSGKNRDNEENHLFFRTLIDDYLCVNTFFWFDRACGHPIKP